MDGKSFENEIVQLYRHLGRLYVTHDRVIDVSTNLHSMRVQMDITYETIFGRRYVECKYYNGAVGLDEVAKFSAQLDLLKVSGRMGEVVTNSYFVQRAYGYAKKKGIILIDGEKLDLMRRNASYKKKVFGYCAGKMLQMLS